MTASSRAAHSDAPPGSDDEPRHGPVVGGQLPMSAPVKPRVDHHPSRVTSMWGCTEAHAGGSRRRVLSTASVTCGSGPSTPGTATPGSPTNAPPSPWCTPGRRRGRPALCHHTRRMSRALGRHSPRRPPRAPSATPAVNTYEHHEAPGAEHAPRHHRRVGRHRPWYLRLAAAGPHQHVVPAQQRGRGRRQRGVGRGLARRPTNTPSCSRRTQNVSEKGLGAPSRRLVVASRSLTDGVEAWVSVGSDR